MILTHLQNKTIPLPKNSTTKTSENPKERILSEIKSNKSFSKVLELI
jgi:hypothetical protein